MAIFNDFFPSFPGVETRLGKTEYPSHFEQIF